jgi:hypothetical protein
MKITAKIIFSLALTGLLNACSVYKPAISKASSSAAKPQVQADRKIYYIPPLKLPDKRTVENNMQKHKPYGTRKLNLYFSKAKVSYPPQEVIFIAMKQEKKLELWARGSGEFHFIHEYYIQAASGVSGPKLHQGDKQVPEGIYRIVKLNPNSNYHLSMKLNYPNEFDISHARQEGRTSLGSNILIHGKAVSSGCLAMGDEAIEELFIVTKHVGLENVKVVITPHDPRTYPLKSDSKGLPAWAPELYAAISSEISALSPMVKPPKTRILPSRMDFVRPPPQL